MIKTSEKIARKSQTTILKNKKSRNTNVGLKINTDSHITSSDEGSLSEQKSEWNAEAKALRQAIADGAFDGLSITHDDDIETSCTFSTDKKRKRDSEDKIAVNASSEDSASEGGNNILSNGVMGNHKGLQTITSHLMEAKALTSWSENFDIIATRPLPFGDSIKDSSVIDVHDDIKREVEFYKTALEAVHEAKQNCKDCSIPFSRPDDFLAEMVKSDDHMAKVKDRLIFESKKIEAFESRKSNHEQKLRAKEANAHRLLQKAKARKKHMEGVEEWAKSSASNRLCNGRIHDDDDYQLKKIGVGDNKRRMAMNKKYGYGGKQTRFKQNDRKSLNDMSGFNPYAGKNSSRSAEGKRKGKRARDAARARR